MMQSFSLIQILKTMTYSCAWTSFWKLEIQSSKRTSKVQYQAQMSTPAKKKLSANSLNAERIKTSLAEKKKVEIVQIYNCNKPKDDQVNQLIKHAEQLENTHSWTADGNKHAVH